MTRQWQSEPVAIVGRAGFFPGCRDLNDFWGLNQSGRSVVGEFPKERYNFDTSVICREGGGVDRAPHMRGGFVDPSLWRSAASASDELFDPAVAMAIAAAEKTCSQTNSSAYDAVKKGVIIASHVLPFESTANLTWDLFSQNVLQPAGFDLDPDFELRSKRHYTKMLAVAPAVANSLGFLGDSYSLDAACGSSLLAFQNAVNALRSGKLDFVVSGGICRTDFLYETVGFHQIGALSKNGICRSFDENRDGLVVGEGVGFFALKRLDDALKDNDKIFGLITGCGSSNDTGESLLAPDREGQVRALKAAYADAGIDPWRAELLECHATATRVGDATELSSLKELWQGAPSSAKAALSCVKPNIGHLLTAAGSAGLMRVLGAFENNMRPPMAMTETPMSELEGAPFFVPKQGLTWDAKVGERAAGVSGFGFGGINGHIVVEDFDPSRPPQVSVAELPQKPARRRVALVATGSVHPGADFAVGMEQFKIQPLEIKAMMPQAIFSLLAAKEAWAKTQISKKPGPHKAVAFVGLEPDLYTSRLACRWKLASLIENSTQASVKDLEAYYPEISKPLNAESTKGELGCLVTSRLAREFGFNQASYAVSSLEMSGLRALEMALERIQNGDVDTAIIGATDTKAVRFDSEASLQYAGKDLSHGSIMWVLRDYDSAVADGETIITEVCSVSLKMKDSAETGHVCDLLPSMQRMTEAACRSDTENAVVKVYDSEFVISSCDQLEVSSAAKADQFSDSERFGRSSRVDAFADLPKGTRIVCASGESLGECLQHFADLSSLTTKTGILSLNPEPKAASWRLALVQFGDDSGEALRNQLAALNAGEINQTNREMGIFINACANDAATGRLAAEDKVGFVFPGVGNHYGFMGRELVKNFPSLVAMLADQISDFANLWSCETFWQESVDVQKSNSEAGMLSQGMYATLLCEIFKHAGIEPSAVSGFSTGEAVGLFATGAVAGRDELIHNIRTTDVFSQMVTSNPYGKDGGEWCVKMLRADPETVRREIAGEKDCYLLATTSKKEVICGGEGKSLDGFAKRLGATSLDLPHTGVVHSPFAEEHLDELVRLHSVAFSPVKGRRYYSCHSGEAYVPSDETVTKAIVGHCVYGIDFVKTIAAMHEDGVRSFVCMGPGNFLGRRIAETLEGNEYLSANVGTSSNAEVSDVLFTLADLYVNGASLRAKETFTKASRFTLDMQFPARLAIMPGVNVATTKPATEHLAFHSTRKESILTPSESSPTATIQSATIQSATVPTQEQQTTTQQTTTQQNPVQQMGIPQQVPQQMPTSAFSGDVLVDAESQAHKDYLELANNYHMLMAETIKLQTQLMQNMAKLQQMGQHPQMAPLATQMPAQGAGSHTFVSHTTTNNPAPAINRGQVGRKNPLEMTTEELIADHKPLNNEKPWLDYADCLEYARGSIGKVLGEQFAEIDNMPTRVRLPDEPILYCHRIMDVGGEPCSLKPGTLVTEHDVFEDAWYLENGHITPWIAIEAGQADLFLSGYLGADYFTKGQAMYRMLDASMTMHGPLPSAGKTIRYNIQINEFFNQGNTLLFRFQYDATIDGKPFITMRDGCAGFFTQEQLDDGKGIVESAMDRKVQPCKFTGGFEPTLRVNGVEKYNREQVNMLRSGDLEGCFGADFAGNRGLREPCRLPDGLMGLIEEVSVMTTEGGKFGFGYVRSEANIVPNSWYLNSHFVDDKVMPGTLMYECCMHTLRVFMMRIGFVSEVDAVVPEPVPGVRVDLKCRGQVTERTKAVSYEVHPKEVGYNPHPYAICDATMFVDGKPAVSVKNLSLQFRG